MTFTLLLFKVCVVAVFDCICRIASLILVCNFDIVGTCRIIVGLQIRLLFLCESGCELVW